MTDPYAALRAAIDAGPTPGQWEIEQYDSGAAHIIGPGSHHIAAILFSAHTSREQQDAAYIAAASPDVIRALLAERDELAADAQRLQAALAEAADDIAGWGIYASEYFQEKHDLAGCVAKYRALVAAQGEPT